MKLFITFLVLIAIFVTAPVTAWTGGHGAVSYTGQGGNYGGDSNAGYSKYGAGKWSGYPKKPWMAQLQQITTQQMTAILKPCFVGCKNEIQGYDRQQWMDCARKCLALVNIHIPY